MKKTTKSKSKPALRDTYTVRDMSRNAAAVLRATLAHGQVRIRSRNGTDFLITPDRTAELRERMKDATTFTERQRAYRDLMYALGNRPPALEDLERFNSIIAGEE